MGEIVVRNSMVVWKWQSTDEKGGAKLNDRKSLVVKWREQVMVEEDTSNRKGECKRTGIVINQNGVEVTSSEKEEEFISNQRVEDKLSEKNLI